MELRLTARRFENLFVMLVIPPALLAFFGAVPVLSTGTDRPVDFLLPGVLALAVISTAFVNLGIATGFERGYGVLEAARRVASAADGAARGEARARSALIEVIQVVLLIAIAAVAFGWRPAPDASAVVLAGGLVGGTLAFAGLGLLLAGTLRAEGTLALANGLFLAFLLLGGIVLPLSHLPGPLEALARLLPAAALSDVIRVGLEGGSATSSARSWSWSPGASVPSRWRSARSAGSRRDRKNPEPRARGSIVAALGCGEGIRTPDLRVMSPTSCRCSTPRLPILGTDLRLRKRRPPRRRQGRPSGLARTGQALPRTVPQR